MAKQIETITDRLLRRTPPHELFPPLAYSPDGKFYLLDNQSIGYAVFCQPLIGVDEATVGKMQLLLREECPADTIISISLWAGPDIARTLLAHKNERDMKEDTYYGEPHKVANGLSRVRREYLSRKVSEPLDASGAKVRNVQCVVSVVWPIRGTYPNEAEIELIGRHRTVIEQVLRDAGMWPRLATPDEYLRLMQTLLNWKPSAGWRQGVTRYDSNELIRKQFLDLDTAIERKRKGLSIGEKEVRTFSVKRYPEYVHLANTAKYLSNVVDGGQGIRANVLITLNIHMPDRQDARTKVEAKKDAITWQAQGPLIKYVPRLKRQKDSFDAVTEAITDGDRIVQAYLSMALFADSNEEADAEGANLRTYFSELGFDVHEDVFVSLPIFINALPLCVDRHAKQHLMRYRTMASRHAVALMPVSGDWPGTGRPVSLLSSRNGQLVSFNLFDSPTNYNAVVAAESGSGKSFLIANLIPEYLSLGADIYVIEIGRSLEHQCKLLGGEHVEFSPTSEVSLNPFSVIESYEDQSDMLIAVLLAMIFPRGEPDDFQVQMLKKVARALWDEKGRDASIDELAERLETYRAVGEDGSAIAPDRRITDMGTQIYSFTSKGPYGKWFTGPSNINFHNPFTVLELVELRGQRDLQKVVLVQLINVIQRAMYLGDPGRPKLLIIDEAFELLIDGAAGLFIQQGVRQLRKHGGGAIIILQSINDLYNSPVGEAIAENSAHKILLGQREATIDKLAKEDRLELGEGGVRLLKTVHTAKGRYSEMFIMAPTGAGICRLYVDRRTMLRCSTDPRERAALKHRMESGLDLLEAIESIVQEERGGAKGIEGVY